MGFAPRFTTRDFDEVDDGVNEMRCRYGMTVMCNIKMACAVALSLCLTAWADRAEPVAHYTFAEEAGETVNDASGNGNNGQIHGARFITGKAGSALRFNGETDYVGFGDAPGLKFTDAVAITAWIYPESVPEKHSQIVGRKESAFGLYQCIMVQSVLAWAVPNYRVYCSAPMGRKQWNHVAPIHYLKPVSLLNDRCAPAK